MTLKLFLSLTITLCVIQACGDKQVIPAKNPIPPVDSIAYNNTRGVWENGQIVEQWDCPDSKFFPPIDIKSWDKTEVVNGRLPTYAETKNGTAIFHYGEKENPNVKPYNMILPRLAYHYSPLTTSHLVNIPLAYMKDIVVITQIVQTAQDTIVGYRYLSGGCGGDKFREFYFLTEEEAKKAVGQN